MHKTLTISMLLLLAGWLLGGCSSEETAANDPLPELSEEDVAHQSGYMALALVEVLPIALNYSGKADASDGRYQYTFVGDEISGVVQLYFENGDAPSGYDVADYCRAWTDDGEPLEILPVSDGIPWLMAFSLESDIDQGAGSATVNGSGTLTVGDYEAAYDVIAVAVQRDNSWPVAGDMVFTDEGITATVTFDGDDTATVTIGETDWSLDLGDGELIEL